MNGDGGTLSETFFAYGQKFEALLGLGDLHGLERAVDEFERDFESSPVRSVAGYRAGKLVSGYNAAMTLALLRGRIDDVERVIAEASAHEARRVNPLGFGFVIEFGRTEVAYFRGDWAGATKGWERTRVVAPGAMDVYFGFSGIGCTLAELEAYVDAWFRIDATSPLITKASNVAVVAEGLRRLGDRDRSATYGERLTDHAGFLVTNSTLYCRTAGPGVGGSQDVTGKHAKRQVKAARLPTEGSRRRSFSDGARPTRVGNVGQRRGRRGRLDGPA